MKTYYYEVLRDGEILSTFDNYTEAMAHLHRIQPHSVAWATEHEGYAITEQQEWSN
jgi:ribosomal protein L24E